MTEPEAGFYETGVDTTVQVSATLLVEEVISWSAPPRQILPLRNYRAVMGEYRMLGGTPKSPPPLDCAIPVRVSLMNPADISVPSATRKTPAEVDTQATLRWITDPAYLVGDGGLIGQWWDTTSSVSWNAHDTWEPLYADDYVYLIPKPNTDEVVARPSLVFDNSFGTCMDMLLTGSMTSNDENIEFFIVTSSHPLASGQQVSSIFDNGDPVQGSADMPFDPGDSLPGTRQALQRIPGGKLVAYQDKLSMALAWPQSTSGRPILIRMRFGTRPVLETWGAKRARMVYHAPKQARTPLSVNYVLGRQFGKVSAVTNAGMHLFEVDYYDHALTDDEVEDIAHAYDICYAISP
jgi:hypothetical protein